MKTHDISFLTDLTQAFGPSGAEDNVRELIARRINPYTDRLYTDPLGNLIAVKGHGGKVLISAHMDEVALMVTGLSEDGTYRFDCVGGMVPNALPSKRVYFPEKNVYGVIGAVPVHMRKGKKSEISFADLYIDTCGISLDAGDLAIFATETRYFDRDGGLLMGKAIDDRLGCYLMCRLIEDESVQNGTFIFTVQEETGLLGASAAIYDQPFSFGIALDVTTPNDLPEIEGPQTVCSLHRGPVISYADGRTIYDRDTMKEIFSLLHQFGIPCQTKALRTGGNESYCFQNSKEGMIAISLSVPCRYIHGPIGVLSLEDVSYSEEALYHIIRFLEEKNEKLA